MGGGGGGSRHGDRALVNDELVWNARARVGWSQQRPVGCSRAFARNFPFGVNMKSFAKFACNDDAALRGQGSASGAMAGPTLHPTRDVTSDRSNHRPFGAQTNPAPARSWLSHFLCLRLGVSDRDQGRFFLELSGMGARAVKRHGLCGMTVFVVSH